ncbi:bifunctional 5,10-methylenetetrahydrofolate dehydrogenase/5,10-methenyltetrahydrofolate cyclohydrolase [Streptomyces violascens]|uniref:Uncharacterized protein n=1 Tax=Streptomyces violascens TaxID=67381 RepID=A0ABQ3QL53_9ACTN|nr:bifunctional 5,10-methylenetetrahydrofolate dehydrogenase/5,10-methenyltetrahydrofolate cyclohydrolase [Streptomyces violascens]GGU44582.1 hypothetical protein GCM10010289_76460 [Streptomyces violascens]GHI38017.1 hypothetical protein Sviol_24250 [Streptomyces violascens]
MTHQLSGRALLRTVREDLGVYRDRIEPARLRVAVIRFTPADGDPPEWALRMEASRVSAEQKYKAFTHLGLTVDPVVLPGTVSAAEFAAHIDACNADPATRAVIVQFPPPARLTSLVHQLDPAKDIDGLLGGRSLHRACATADGISRIVAAFDADATVAVVGARGFVGSGVVHLLEDRGTPVLPLDQGDDLRQAARADIVVSTAGSAHLLTAEHIRPHHRLVVDSGFSPQPDGSVAGDIHPGAAGIPQNLTPVPGGVGPVEMAVLMERIVRQTADPELRSWAFPSAPYVSRSASAPGRQEAALSRGETAVENTLRSAFGAARQRADGPPPPRPSAGRAPDRIPQLGTETAPGDQGPSTRAADPVSQPETWAAYSDADLISLRENSQRAAATAMERARELQQQHVALRTAYEEQDGGALVAQLREQGAAAHTIARARTAAWQDLTYAQQTAVETRTSADAAAARVQAIGSELQRRAALPLQQRQAEDAARQALAAHRTPPTPPPAMPRQPGPQQQSPGQGRSL